MPTRSHPWLPLPAPQALPMLTLLSICLLGAGCQDTDLYRFGESDDDDDTVIEEPDPEAPDPEDPDPEDPEPERLFGEPEQRIIPDRRCEVRVSIDRDADGDEDGYQRTLWSPGGYQLADEWENPDDGDSEVDSRQGWWGLLPAYGRMAWSASDHDGDGSWDQLSRWQALGPDRASLHRDDDGDGVVDAIETWDWSVAGSQFWTIDDDLDGFPDGEGWSIQDAAGNLVQSGFDADADGTPEQLREIDYDALGRPLEVRQDENGGGWDRIESWDYSGLPTLVVESVDEGADGRVDLVKQWSLDSDGLAMRVRWSWVKEGETTYDFSYDASQRPLRITIDMGADGLPESHHDVIWDSAGLLLRQDLDHDADGVVDEIRSHSSDCPPTTAVPNLTGWPGPHGPFLAFGLPRG